jgi:hypothetical protein
MLFVVATFLKASTFVIYSLECILASIALISTIQLTSLDASPIFHTIRLVFSTLAVAYVEGSFCRRCILFLFV